jgi:hypothetical protein
VQKGAHSQLRTDLKLMFSSERGYIVAPVRMCVKSVLVHDTSRSYFKSWKL